MTSPEEEEELQNPFASQVSSSSTSSSSSSLASTALLRRSDIAKREQLTRNDALRKELRLRRRKHHQFVSTAARLLAPAMGDGDVDAGFDWVIEELRKPRELPSDMLDKVSVSGITSFFIISTAHLHFLNFSTSAVSLRSFPLPR